MTEQEGIPVVIEAATDDITAKRGRPRTPRLTTPDYIRLYEAKGYNLRLNLCNDDVELDGKPLDDATQDRIISGVRDHGITRRVSINVAHAKEALNVMAADNAYHPIKEYLDGLEWDGQDHIARLCEYIQERSEKPQFQQWFAHWLVGAVARVYESFQNPMFVIDGPQDIGKSYLARWLCPVKRYHHEGAIYPDSQHCRLRLIDTWVWEVMELGSTTKRQDLEALKAFLTTEVVREHKPYGHRDTIKPVMASFIGTINNDAGFLIDRTGNRRFLVCAVDKIDWAYADDVSRNQLWAQAYATYQQGEAWKLTNAERLERDETNEAYLVDDPVEAMLCEALEFTGNPADFVTLPQLLAILRDRCTVNQKSQTMTIASVLRARGADKRRPSIDGTRTITYYGVKLT